MNRSKFSERSFKLSRSCIYAVRFTALVLAISLFASGAFLPAGAAQYTMTWGSDLGEYDVLIQRAYNEYGLLTSEVNSRSRDATLYEYDENGVLHQKTIHDFESDAVTIYSTQTILYDEHGNRNKIRQSAVVLLRIRI